MKVLTTVIILFYAYNLFSQDIIEDYEPLQGTLKIGEKETDVLPLNAKGYSLILPKNREGIKGIVISLEDTYFDFKKEQADNSIHLQANEEGLAVLYVTTGVPIDLYFQEKTLVFVDSLIHQVISKNNLPNNIFLLGVMTSGHRALKYIEYSKAQKSVFQPNIKGVVLCESALDWVRQWYEGQKQVRDNLTEVGFFEGNLVTYLFKTNMGDTPQSNIQKYLDFSPYSYFDTKMAKTKLYTTIAMRAYTFADTTYWFSAKGKGIYDCNYPDMSGIINEQKLAKNTKAELIVFTKKINLKGEAMQAQSSTWQLVDKKELVKWMMEMMK